ncbi:unnamed protein product, partial [Meganyctiphanes norvegica]
MANEECKKCKRKLEIDEQNLCAYCVGNQEKNCANAIAVNCGICKVIVEEDSEGLFCDVCNTWFHNCCNTTPLNYELYALLNEAPDNLKWFCDKCIWETEKWIKMLNSNHETSTMVANPNEIVIVDKVNKEPTKPTEEINVGGNEYNNPLIPEIKIEVVNENYETEDLENEESDHSDEWLPIEENEEVIKIKQKKKLKSKLSEKTTCENIRTISEDIAAENISDLLDISPEKLLNFTNEILSVDQLKQHKLKHIRAKCDLCPRAFLHFEDCVAHKLSDHEGVQKPYKCSICKKTFDTKRHRKRHMENHSSEKTFSCHMCGKMLKNNDSLRRHLNFFHTDEKIHSCTECDYRAKYKMALNKHMINKHSSETEIQCNICSKSFASECFLKYHMAVHSSEKQFACEVCKKRFTTERQKQQHMLRHAAEKPFECAECDKKFASKELLKKHLPSHLPNEERPLACDQCDLRFNTLSALNYHKQMHATTLKVICDVCGKGFRDPYYLKRHKMMHTDERPFKCEICNKGFRTSGHLDLHTKYHKKIVNACCPICGFGAPTKSVLNTHIKLVHTNETPFECDICGNKYKTKGNLSKHKRGIRGSCKGYNISDTSVQ